MLLLVLPPVLLVAAPLSVILATRVVPPADLQRTLVLLAVLPLLTPLLLRVLGRTWDPLLLSPVWVLCALGLVVIARVQPQLVSVQALWITLGWALFIAVAGFPPLLSWLRRFRTLWLGLAIAMVLSTLFLATDVNGSGTRIWLRVGPISIQPGEVLRIVLIGFIATYLTERGHLLTAARRHAGRFPVPPRAYWLPLLSMVGVSLLAVAAQRDFGPAILFVAGFLGMLYIATGRRDAIVAAFLGFLVLAPVAYAVSAHIHTRILAWVDPWSDPRGVGYQSLQAIGGLVFGGVAGTGPGYGFPGVIPAAHTDYPLAVIGEEWGLVGSLAVVLLYGLLVARGLTRAQFSDSRFEQLLGGGLALSIGVQIIVVSAGVLRMLPLTGVTSPFVSYGGSSMLMTWVILAVLSRTGEAPSARFTPDAGAVVRRTQHVAYALLAGFVTIALGLGYWQVLRADLAADPRVGGERLNLETARVERGRLLDRNGTVLADTVLGPTGPERRYSSPSAVHALGFNSPRFGAAGAEEAVADRLMGRSDPTPAETLLDLLHEPRAGSDVRLTLDDRLQRVAAQAMGSSSGALVALDPRTGQVLALVSTPTFNPNFVEEEWNRLRTDAGSPLLNRVTQGLYTPGSTFKTITLVAAVEAGLVKPDDPATCPPEVIIDGTRVTSQNEPPGKQTRTVADAYAYSCNTVFAQLGVQVGAARLRATAEALGLTEAPSFTLETVAGRLSTDGGFLSSNGGLAATAYGQGQLQISPLTLVLATAAIANGGVVPQPRLLLDDQPAPWRTAMSAETARLVTEMMVRGTTDGWASTAAIPGVGVAAKTGSAEVAPDESSDALFIAFAPADAPSIAVVVVKERGGAGSTQAGPVARAVIDAWVKLAP
ncbi:MAG: FtsW/RodA/SpoVE family cell cycle protein [Chloroflexi bacterium]|nr:FtsW/RodA/SpoVE family cell cycle protein [Chloroflexota bacterium]